eukprot:5698282-Prymnesium_polylepis.1
MVEADRRCPLHRQAPAVAPPLHRQAAAPAPPGGCPFEALTARSRRRRRAPSVAGRAPQTTRSAARAP